uniref:Phosphoenolpyruvate carboxykinase [GTP] n=1 Tax=Thermofilum pendens TaxID=2269 RepID=A0A7J3X7R7_THEPE
MRFPGAARGLEVRDPLEVIAGAASAEQLERISRVPNEKLLRDIAEVVLVAEPASIFVHTGSPEDREYVRRRALENGEEIPSRHPRHTVHFDGPLDLARDKGNTRILLSAGEREAMVNTLERDKGLAEISQLFRGVMRGREMFISFYIYGPEGSPLSLYGVQVTDSAYVVHSEDILYRSGYRVFLEEPDLEYMLFIHSSGERDEHGWSKNVEKRRIYIDLQGNAVYSVNTQYAGNTVGLKKLALRLAVYKGLREGWLAEHMFIVGMKGPGGRLTYFTGAFPAGCGKTATTMIADTVVGDDLALIREIGGEARAVNPEVGMFGIIDGVNPADDPEVYELLVNPEAEIIFCNVLLTEDGEVWWRGKPTEPRRGLNYAGEWWPGRVDAKGREVPPSHPNARFTVSIRLLEKLDPRIDDPMGVPVSGFIFGGRDPVTLPPLVEAFDWQHGIVTMGAALESERTAAVLGKTGVMELNPFAILDFLPISPGKFTELHFRFARKLTRVPRVFQVNYFLRGRDGGYLAEKRDKIVWLRWMEHRVHGELDAVASPIGYIPLYEDLRALFDEHLGKDFPEHLYEEMFAMRAPLLLAKIERVRSAYEQDPDAPPELFEVLSEQYRRVEELRSRHGDWVSPFKLDRK